MGKKTIIIPCYNEAHRLLVDEYRVFLRENDFSILFVNDGSTDNTNEVLQKLIEEFTGQLEILDLPINSGKAEAVRLGILKALLTSDEVAFIDADMSVSLVELKTMFQRIEKYSFVFGSRIKTLNNNIERKWLRHYISRVFATMVSTVVGLPIYDSQCGVKIFKKELAIALFDEKFFSRWLFDVEIFFRLKRLYNLKEIQAIAYEYPLIQWQEKGGSKLRVKDFFIAPYRLWQIRKKYR